MWDEWITRTIDDLRQSAALRSLRAVEPLDARAAVVDGREVVLACGNGYLDLGRDPEVVAAAREALERWGASSASSRFVAGDHPLHEALEAECAALVGAEAALVVGSGYLANTGLLRALGRGAAIASDERNHASIVDGCLAARAAAVGLWRHADPDDARRALAGLPGDRALLITESLFSVDGDLAPLAALAAAARERGALFVVDEAHALGTTGPGGRGGLAQAGVRRGPDVVVVGTLGKALGSYGAFVACSRRMRDLLASRMRTAIYSTALPPPVLAASLAAVRKLRREPGIVDRLHDNARALRSRLAEAGLRVPGEPWSPILPVVVGSNSAALAAAAAILERGVLAPALRPPTVPEGTARIRISVSAAHTPQDIDLIARAVSEAVEAAKGGRR